jgi:hypothetical protein
MEKEIVMARVYRKPVLSVKPFLLWLSASLLGGMLGGFPGLPTSAAPQTRQQQSNANGNNTTLDMAGAMDNIKKSENSEGTHEPGVDDPANQPAKPGANRRDQALVRANYEKAKHDSMELAELAKSLQQELNQAGTNVLSLDVIDKAAKIEKLAKRIKGNARGL